MDSEMLRPHHSLATAGWGWADPGILSPQHTQGNRVVSEKLYDLNSKMCSLPALTPPQLPAAVRMKGLLSLSPSLASPAPNSPLGSQSAVTPASPAPGAVSLRDTRGQQTLRKN